MASQIRVVSSRRAEYDDNRSPKYYLLLMENLSAGLYKLGMISRKLQWSIFRDIIYYTILLLLLSHVEREWKSDSLVYCSRFCASKVFNFDKSKLNENTPPKPILYRYIVYIVCNTCVIKWNIIRNTLKNSC